MSGVIVTAGKEVRVLRHFKNARRTVPEENENVADRRKIEIGISLSKKGEARWSPVCGSNSLARLSCLFAKILSVVGSGT